MLKNVLLFVNLLFFDFRHIEARVYCQDSNAKPWVPVGFTCPVVCASVRGAIDKLIMLDYKNTLNDQFGATNKFNNNILKNSAYLDNKLSKQKYLRNNNCVRNKESKADTEKVKEFYKNDVQINAKYNKVLNKNDIKMRTGDGAFVDQYIALFRNFRNVKDILRRSSNTRTSNSSKVTNRMTGKCWYLEKFTVKLLLGKVGIRPCSRKSSFDDKFVQIMTNVLNKYADSLFKFTEEMTEILLENIFGSNSDVRNNILDVNKLLRYLRKSVDLHKNHADGHIVTLKSKQCLTLALPGCFCKPGFVESIGQCVLPSDCVTAEYEHYLARIIVL